MHPTPKWRRLLWIPFGSPSEFPLEAGCLDLLHLCLCYLIIQKADRYWWLIHFVYGDRIVHLLNQVTPTVIEQYLTVTIYRRPQRDKYQTCIDRKQAMTEINTSPCWRPPYRNRGCFHWWFGSQTDRKVPTSIRTRCQDEIIGKSLSHSPIKMVWIFPVAFPYYLETLHDCYSIWVFHWGFLLKCLFVF